MGKKRQKIKDLQGAIERAGQEGLCALGLHHWRVEIVILTTDGVNEAGDVYVKPPLNVMHVCNACEMIWPAGCTNSAMQANAENIEALTKAMDRGLQLKTCVKRQPPHQ